jgi:glycopeptide antibiotics resistance protein
MTDLIKSKSKAIGAALATLIVTLGAKYIGDVDVNALGGIIAVVIVGVVTYISPKNTEKKNDEEEGE